MKKWLILSCIAITAIATFVYLVGDRSSQPQPTPHPSIVSSSTVESLAHKDASKIDISHLADDIIPPTNKWFSGLALQEEPRAVFPSPLSFLAKEDSFEIGLPVVDTTEKTIFGSHAASMTVSVNNATSYKVTRYDELTVDLTYYTDTSPVGTVTLTAGSPLIFFTALQDATVTLPVALQPTIAGNRASIANDTSTSVVAGFNKASISSTKKQLTASLPAGSFVTLYELPKDAQDTLSNIASHRIVSSRVDYTDSGDTYTTTISLKTADSQASALTLLPHQTPHNISTTKLNYATIYGTASTAIGQSFNFTTPAIKTEPSLDISKISALDKELLVTTLRQDINATTFTAEDSYFGGKGLYRAAQLLELAHQLDERQIATSIQQKLRRELITWFSASPRSKKSFYYDTTIHGVVGQTVAFGSEEFNDHHFHYGYFIYAASILAKYDPEFLEQNKDMVNLLVADIANYNSGENLPLRRAFDPYFGHSWASGSSPFSDGNNQESSSEAINAWIGISLWATQIENTALQTQAEWMLSSEVASTASYWMNFSSSATPYIGYDKKIVSLNWGGKRDYGTFFSAEPSAMLGILLIPMSPSTVYQSTYGERIDQQVNEALPTMDIDAQFADYILMYSALRGVSDQLNIAKSMRDETIDGANSRSYLYAWIMSQK